MKNEKPERTEFFIPVEAVWRIALLQSQGIEPAVGPSLEHPLSRSHGKVRILYPLPSPEVQAVIRIATRKRKASVAEKRIDNTEEN